jgi:hypothetical protein
MRKVYKNKGVLLVARETRTCAAPDCDITFVVKVTSKRKYCCSGHSACGRKYSKERNRKIGLKNRGKVRSEEANEKNRQAHLGRKRSAESVRKSIETRKKNALVRGYWHSKETRNKIGSSNSVVLKGRKVSEESLVRRKFPREIRICALSDCNITFEVIVGGYDSNRKYCSPACANKASLGRIVPEETIVKLRRITQDYWDTIPLEIAEARIAKAMKASREATGMRPNKFECVCMDKLNKIYPGKFKYTGDGTFLVNRHSADAYSEELNTVALFNGAYWHLECNDLENTSENKKLRESIESKPFLDAGYNVFFIWEGELNTIVRQAC